MNEALPVSDTRIHTVFYVQIKTRVTYASHPQGYNTYENKEEDVKCYFNWTNKYHGQSRLQTTFQWGMGVGFYKVLLPNILYFWLYPLNKCTSR